MGGNVLAGFSYGKVAHRLGKLGAELKRQASGSHEIWWRADLRRTKIIPKHRGDLKPGTRRAILDVLGYTVDQFLNAR